MEQGAHDAGHDGDGGDVIAQPTGQNGWRRAGRRGTFGQAAAARKSRHVVARCVTVGAFQPVGRKACVDQPRVLREQRRMVEPDALQELRPHIGDEHVGTRQQLLHQRDSVRVVDVERNTFLAAVVEVERWAAFLLGARQGAEQLAHRVAARHLDLDHFGAPVGQDSSGRGPRYPQPHLDHPDSGKQAHILTSAQNAAVLCGLGTALRLIWQPFRGKPARVFP